MTCDFGTFVRRSAAERILVVQPRMGVSDPVRMRAGIAATKDAGTRTAGTITLDSYTRVGEHGRVRSALAAGGELNGYPIVDHPADVTRAMLDGIVSDSFPVQVRHGSPKPQLIVAALMAAGLHATEGGPISYCLPYSRVPLSEAIAAWRESTVLLGTARDDGVRPHLETFGGCMMGQLCPPALLVAISVLECLFFRAHGVDSVSLSYAQQTHPGQDVEALRALRALAAEFLADVEWHVVLYAYMGVFPRTPEGATGLLADAARLSVRGGAERLIVKTVAEAHRIPTIEENVLALRIAGDAARAEHLRLRTRPWRAAEDTGIAEQARAIITSVLDLAPVLDTALLRAVQKGLLDVPFCLHPDNRGETGATIDGAGRLQWTRIGHLALRGLAETSCRDTATAAGLLRSISYLERQYDDEPIERMARAGW